MVFMFRMPLIASSLSSDSAAGRAAPAWLAEIPTPALVLDRDRLERNLDRMRWHAYRLGVTLRPHLKTAKCAEIARLALPEGGGITVSTVREAEYFLEHGFRDIFYAVAVAPGKLPRLGELARRGARILLAVDHPAIAAAVSEHTRKQRVRLDVLIEIDSGEARSGVKPESPLLGEIAAALDYGAGLAGVFTHGGHSYAGRSPDDHARVAEQERAAVVAAAARLREAGRACEIVSVGSSPSVTHARHLDGVTEARAGVYMFGDLFQAGIGMCDRSDLALSVVATVIGHRREANRLLIDAGAFALSKDRSTAKLGPAGDCGYGLVTTADGDPVPGLQVIDVYQEHGVVQGTGAIDFDRFPLGSQVRVWPNHACPTAAAHDRYHVVRGASVEAVWPRINGW